jgi:integrase
MKGCRPLTAQEMHQVSQSFEGAFALRNRALFVVGLTTGFRISELLSVRVGNVLQRGSVGDWLTVHKRHMKQQQEGRTMRLNAEAKTALQVWLSHWQSREPLLLQQPERYCFPSRKGSNRPLTRIQAWKAFERAFARCGLSGTLGTHCMRKTFGMHIYERTGHNLRATQRALGHAHITSTERYLPYDDQEIEAAVLAMVI